MCNHQPEGKQTISTLKAYDQQIINKLEQVQVIHRHGSRSGSDRIDSFLPNTTLKYNCNITSVETRNYKNNNYYIHPNQTFASLRKQYVEDEQSTEGNCGYRQALKYLIPQQQANAHHLQQAYIGQEPYHVFNQSILNSIALNLIKYSEDERLILTTTDYARTIASLVAITSELFANTFNEMDDTSMDDIIMNANVHDVDSDPYHSDDITACIQQSQFKKWETMFDEDSLLNNTEAIKVVNSEFGKATISAYESEGGKWKSDKVGTMLLYPYCAGMTLPLENDTFWNAVQLSYDWGTSFVNTSYAKNKTECYNNFMNIPMLYKMQNDINMLKNTNNEYPKLVLHSAHDSTVIRLLQSLGVYDYHLIIFGEMITLEIYSDINDTELYWFRLTRKGQFVPYPRCDYYNDETELCDLDILLENSFSEVVSQTQWSSNLCANVLSDCRWCAFACC